MLRCENRREGNAVFAIELRSGETAAWGPKDEPTRPARIRPSAGAGCRADGAALGRGDRRLGGPEQVRRPALSPAPEARLRRHGLSDQSQPGRVVRPQDLPRHPRDAAAARHGRDGRAAAAGGRNGRALRGDRRALPYYHHQQILRRGAGGCRSRSGDRAPGARRRHAPHRTELPRPDQPREPRGAVLLAGARGRSAASRSHRLREPERCAHGDAVRPRGIARHRLLALRIGGQPGRPRDLRLRRVFSGGRADPGHLHLCRGLQGPRAFRRPRAPRTGGGETLAAGEGGPHRRGRRGGLLAHGEPRRQFRGARRRLPRGRRRADGRPRRHGAAGGKPGAVSRPQGSVGHHPHDIRRRRSHRGRPPGRGRHRAHPIGA